MNKTLFTNGCSWTFGGGLDQPDTRERILDIKPETNDCHPDELGHEQLAEYIIEAIAKKKSILRTL